MHTYLYRARKDAPPLHRLTESQRAELVESIGATEIVRMKLDELFPDLQWVRIAGVWSRRPLTIREADPARGAAESGVSATVASAPVLMFSSRSYKIGRQAS